jgi:hypothetical protein
MSNGAAAEPLAKYAKPLHLVASATVILTCIVALLQLSPYSHAALPRLSSQAIRAATTQDCLFAATDGWWQRISTDG